MKRDKNPKHESLRLEIVAGFDFGWSKRLHRHPRISPLRVFLVPGTVKKGGLCRRRRGLSITLSVLAFAVYRRSRFYWADDPQTIFVRRSP